MNDTTLPPAEPLTGKDKFFLLLLRFFSRLPLGFLQGLGAGIGRLVALAKSTGPAFIVRRNLDLCFPEQDSEWRERITRDNLVSTAQTALEFTKTWGMPTDYSVAQIKKVHGEEIFHAALAAGKGTIGIIPHFGSWEFMNAWVNQHAAPIIMYKPGKDKGVNQLVLEARSRLHATLVPTDERGVKALLKGIHKNGFIAVLPDHVPHDNGGIFSPFFGISTWTGVMAPKLIGRTGCSVIMMSCVRRPDGDGFEIFYDEPDPDIHNRDVAVATAAMNRSIEALIRRNPAQYQWSYKRFKKNESLPDPYRKPRK